MSNIQPDDISGESAALLNKLSRNAWHFTDGRTQSVETAARYFALAQSHGQQRVCYMPHNGGKPITLRRSRRGHVDSDGVIQVQIPPVIAPGANITEELRWLNNEVARDRGVIFTAVIDRRAGTITRL